MPYIEPVTYANPMLHERPNTIGYSEGIMARARNNEQYLTPSEARKRQQASAARNSQVSSQQDRIAYENQKLADQHQAAMIKAQASAVQAKEDAIAAMNRAYASAAGVTGAARINAAGKTRVADYEQSKYNAIAPTIKSQLAKSGENYGMYNALGGNQPVTRASLGLADSVISDSALGNTNNNYASMMSSAMNRLGDKLGANYSSDSPILQGLMGNFRSAANSDVVASSLQRALEASGYNKDYLIDSQGLLDQRNQTLAGLKNAGMQTKSNLLQALAGM